MPFADPRPSLAEVKAMSIRRFEDLKVWQEARKLAQIIYRLTKGESFGLDRDLRWQLQDAAVSSMGNIAEAHGRYSFEDKRRFPDVSRGSCKEVQSHLYVALDQAYIKQADFDEAYGQAEVVAQLLTPIRRNPSLAKTPRAQRKARCNHGITHTG
ncbi:MAG TPA: four helix bundle protein [Candidatus Methylomirabilis sp.]|nr:four helix bundle protein [Candidatus Methylomirabilis sp.]